MDLFATTYLQSQIFWTAVSFVVLLLLVWRLFMPAINNVLDERARRIRADLEHAERLKTEAEQTLSKYDRQLKKAHAETAALLNKARAEAEDLAAARTAELEEDLLRRAKEASAQIDQAKIAALADLRAEVVTLTLAATRKIIGETVDEDRAKALTEQVIKELDA